MGQIVSSSVDIAIQEEGCFFYYFSKTLKTSTSDEEGFWMFDLDLARVNREMNVIYLDDMLGVYCSYALYSMCPQLREVKRDCD